jgi:hypothetical protein
MTGTEGKVFISHGSPDKPFVRRLAAAIETAGYPTWVDENEILPGDALPARVSAALADATAYIAAISRHSVGSKWFNYELRIATQRMIEGDLVLIPIRLDDAPVPLELTSLLWADFRTDFDFGRRTVIAALARARSHHAPKVDPKTEEPATGGKLIDQLTPQGRRLELILGDYVPEVMATTRLFEVRTESRSLAPLSQLWDFVAHLSTLVGRSELTPDQQDRQLSSAEEHLRRALLEGPADLVSQRFSSLQERWKAYASGVSDNDAGSPPHVGLAMKYRHIEEGMAQVRSHLLAPDFEGTRKMVAHLHEVALLCTDLDAELSQFLNPEAPYLER